MPNPRHQITGPAITPAPYGLLAVAEVRDDPEPRWRNGIEWRSTCPAPASVTIAPCSGDVAAGTGEGPETPPDLFPVVTAYLDVDDSGPEPVPVLTFGVDTSSVDECTDADVAWIYDVAPPGTFAGMTPDITVTPDGPRYGSASPLVLGEFGGVRQTLDAGPEAPKDVYLSAVFSYEGCTNQLSLLGTWTGEAWEWFGSTNGGAWEALPAGPEDGYLAMHGADPWVDPPGVVDWVCSGAVEIPAKTGERGASYVEGPAVTLYAVHECSPIGETDEQAQAEAGRKLAAGEGPALEAVVLAGQTEAGTLAPEFRLNGPTTEIVGAPPGGYPSLESAFGYLEDHLGRRGVGTIYASRGVVLAAIAANLVVRNGARLETALGTPVVAGNFDPLVPGPNGMNAASGILWIYGTGPAVVYRGGVTYLPGFDPEINTRTIIAERTYAYGWECEPLAAPISLTALLNLPDLEE